MGLSSGSQILGCLLGKCQFRKKSASSVFTERSGENALIWQESITSELIAGGIWKGDILKADLEDLEQLDASDIYP